MKKIILFSIILFACFSSYAQSDVKKLYDYAQMAVDMNNTDDAIHYYEQIISLSPDDPRAYYELGCVYSSIKNDSDAAEKAIVCFKKYQLLDPYGAEANDIQTVVNRLEYAAGKIRQFDETIAGLQGRWATTDWRNDPYGNSWIILDFAEVGGKLIISVQPSSAVYNEHFIAQSIVVDMPTDNTCRFEFASDKKYNPSSTKYQAQRSAANLVTGGINNGLVSSVLSETLNLAISSAEEKDVASSTLTRYMFSMDIRKDNEGRMKCRVEISGATSSINGEKQSAGIQEVSFEKVDGDFVNVAVLNRSKVMKYYNSTARRKEVRTMMTACSDPKALKMFNKGNTLVGCSCFFLGAGIGAELPGLIFLGVAGDDDVMTTVGSGLCGGGLLLAGIGGLMMYLGKKSGKKGIDLYNNSLRENRRKPAEWGIEATQNGVGLVYRF